MNLSFLRSTIASVGQEPILFSTTIGENIRYGNPDASDAQIIAAAKDSGAHEFISNLPLGYNTVVGEKGSQMSGGQKQRIAIARALIQNPRILLLDEATSALDYQSEKIVQGTLDRVCRGRTTIVVSHRLSAIRGADRIVFIDKGRAVEEGTHSELVAAKGFYYDMIKTSSLDDGTEKDGILDEDEPVVDGKKEQTLTRMNSTKEHDDPKEYFRESSTDLATDIEARQLKCDDVIQYGKVLKRILKMVQSDWQQLSLGIISALIIGSSLPIFAVLFAEVYGVSMHQYRLSSDFFTGITS